jgi:hypothetical protein
VKRLAASVAGAHAGVDLYLLCFYFDLQASKESAEIRVEKDALAASHRSLFSLCSSRQGK